MTAIEGGQNNVVPSFRPTVLDMIDRKAAAGMTRSGFPARAAEAYQVETARTSTHERMPHEALSR